MENFRPHPWLRGGHAQTLAGSFLSYPYRPYAAVQRLVSLGDGDRLVLHDDCPTDWRPGERVSLLVHGLGGSHASPYVRRLAEKLNDAGVRTFRLDLRGCGVGEEHSRGGAHGASWPDLAVAVEHIALLCPGSPTTLAGFSLGGALALNLAGEVGAARCGNLASVFAVCPPLDLLSLGRRFRGFPARLYDRHFCDMMWRHINRRIDAMVDPPVVDLSRRPRSLRKLDEQIIAPFHGYADVLEYYAHANAGPRLASIRIPTRIVLAADDPVIPIEPLDHYPRSGDVEAFITPSGGHVGFIGRPGRDADTRWIDWRIAEWVLAQPEWSVEARPSALLTAS